METNILKNLNEAEIKRLLDYYSPMILGKQIEKSTNSNIIRFELLKDDKGIVSDIVCISKEGDIIIKKNINDFISENHLPSLKEALRLLSA